MTNPPRVSLIVLAWNGLKLTLEALKSIEGLEAKRVKAETIVVDNGSTDGTEQKLRNHKLSNMPFKLIRNPQNLGFAQGNNVGIKDALKAGADYVLLLNNDVVLPKNLLSQLIGVAQKEKKAGIFSPKIYFASGFEFHRERYKPSERGKVIWFAGGKIDWDNVLSSHRGVDKVDKGEYEKVQETDFATGACMLVKRQVFEKIGLFDPAYFLYWEDADFCQRANRAGFKTLYAPPTHLWHKNAGSSRVGSPLHDYYLTRNRLLFGFKYARFRAKKALILDSLRILMRARVWQRRGVLDYYFGNLGRGSYPVG